MTVRKTDRRTIMTKGMIKDALLELLQNTPYEKITVTALCKQSKISDPFSERKLISSYPKEAVSNAKTAAYPGNHEKLSCDRMGGRKNLPLYAPWKFCRE